MGTDERAEAGHGCPPDEIGSDYGELISCRELPSTDSSERFMASLRCTVVDRPARLSAVLRIRRATGLRAVAARVNWLVMATTPLATGRRFASYSSRSTTPAGPWVASTRYRASTTASWIPVFMPCPPAGLCTCAASPARNTDPRR